MFLHKLVSIVDLPIFFFVSGYFSKIGPDESIKAFKRLFIPYILFSLIYAICMHLIGNDIGVLFIQTSFALWFLIALFAMKMVLPIFDKFRFPILTSFILALIIGFINIDPSLLGITRFFAFLPVFLVGFYFKDYSSKFENKITQVLKNKYAIIGIFILISCILVAYMFPSKIIILAESYDNPYDLIKRSIVLILGIGSTLILNKICTNKKSLITQIGKNSYSIYLFHIYFILILDSRFINKLIPQNEYLFLIFSIITTLLILLLLSRTFVTSILNKMLEIINKIILKE